MSHLDREDYERLLELFRGALLARSAFAMDLAHGSASLMAIDEAAHEAFVSFAQTLAFGTAWDEEVAND
jgi:hypothetical protein